MTDQDRERIISSNYDSRNAKNMSFDDGFFARMSETGIGNGLTMKSQVQNQSQNQGSTGKKVFNENKTNGDLLKKGRSIGKQVYKKPKPIQK